VAKRVLCVSAEVFALWAFSARGTLFWDFPQVAEFPMILWEGVPFPLLEFFPMFAVRICLKVRGFYYPPSFFEKFFEILSPNPQTPFGFDSFPSKSVRFILIVPIFIEVRVLI